MSVIIFIIVLVALIVVHEAGHFFVAKWSGMKVEEFGIGYPPRAAGFTYKGTDYTLNWLPFGGFVKILGEDDSVAGGPPPSDSFVAKPRILQAATLIAGIAMNLLFAWLLVSAILFIGTPRALTDAEAAKAEDAHVAISNVLPGSPAEAAGMIPGDIVLSATYGGKYFSGYDSAAFSDFVAGDTALAPITLDVKNGTATLARTITPEKGLSPKDPERVALGVGIGTIGTLPVSLLSAPIEGAKLTFELVKETAVALVHFFVSCRGSVK
jgi:regulator of sigma E protease